MSMNARLFEQACYLRHMVNQRAAGARARLGSSRSTRGRETRMEPMEPRLLLSASGLDGPEVGLGAEGGVIGGIVVGHVDDFQDGTEMNWREGPQSPNPPFNVNDGGPGGQGDAHIQNESFGDFGAGSRMAMFNTDQWGGDYLSAGVQAIEADMANFGQSPLFMRIGLTTPSGESYVSSQPFVLGPDSNWQQVSFGLSDAEMVPVTTTLPLDVVLSEVAELRILSSEQVTANPNGRPVGDVIPGFGLLAVDNITAVGEPAPPFVEVDQFDVSLGQLLVQIPQPGGEPVEELIAVEGPATVHVTFDGPAEGDALDDDGNRLEEVATEMVALDMTGLSSLGPVQVTLRADQRSTGQIEERQNLQPGTLEVAPFGNGPDLVADSFFDIWPVITIGGQEFVTDQPIRLESPLRHKPPRDGERYINPFTAQPVQLIDAASGQPTGIFVVREVHQPNPPIEVDQFDVSLGQLLVEVRTPDGPVQELIATEGPATVHVYFDGRNEGDAEDDDLDGNDEVITEMVALSMTGVSSMGPVAVGLRTDVRSMGQIEERTNPSPGTLDIAPFNSGPDLVADSFFDIWPVITIGGQTLVTAQPLRLESPLRHKPPQDGERYINPFTQPVELIDPQTGQGTGIFVVREVHQPDPVIERDFMEQTTALVQLQGGPLGPVPQSFILRGSSQAHVFMDGDREGDAEDDDLNGLDEVISELVSLDLSGGGLMLRLRDPAQSPFARSMGRIEERVNNNAGRLDLDPFHPGDADSFFDVLFEIVLPDGTVLHNERPLRIETVIDEKPPQGGRYIHVIPDQPVELYDAAGNATGVFIVNAEHFTGFIERDVMEQTTALVQIADPAGNVSVHILRGPAVAHVFFEGAEGMADDDDGNSRDEVKTELASLELTDGAVHLSLNPDRVSAGQIEEQVDNNTGLLDLDPFAPGNADSFFDVFFNLDVGGLVLHNDAALRIEAVIDEKPPQGGRYIHVIPAAPIELLDENGNRTGFRIVKAEHATGYVEIDEFPNTVATVVLDIPAAPGIVTTSPQLPPDHGDYRTPADVHAEFHGPALDVILQDIRHRPFAETTVRDPVGNGEIEVFDTSLRGTAIVNGVSMPVSLTGPVETFVQTDGQTTGTFQTEMVSMSLSSGDVGATGVVGLPGVLIRESPTQASMGQTSIVDIGGGQFHIDSFFDVFTELSVDGGNNWVAADAPTRVMLVDSGVETATPQLPPDDGVYRSPQDVHAEFHGPDLDVVLQDVAHRRFANVQVERSGPDEIETFDSTLTAVANIGSSGLDGVREVVLTGPVQTIVRGRAGETTGSWDTEMVSMSLTGSVPGGPPIMIRESPTQASLGHTTITALGDGTFNVDSFFDVFTELSVDGGNSWIPADSVVPVELVPPRQVISAVGPTTVAVVFEGAEGVADDDDGNGRDEVETEILSMDLRGTSPRGPVSISVRDDIASTGQIEEQVQSQRGTLDVAPFGDGLADSFFDVWAEIRIGDQVFHTAEALPLDTIIAHKPPQDGERYVNPYVVRVELVDPATGQGTGIFVVREIHQPDPTIEHDVMEQTTALIQLVGGPIGPNPQAFIVRGPAQADVYFEGPNEGDAVDDDFDGLDEVVSELVSLDLSGGGLTVRESAVRHSLGAITEQVNNTPGLLDLDPFAPGAADSFFDVFFEVELGGLVLHNERPMRIEAVIDEKPPQGGRYIHVVPDQPVELYDAAGNATGVFIVNAEHFTGFIEWDEMPDTTALIQIEDPEGNVSVHILRGPASAHVFFEGAEGAADDDDGNNRDEVKTELGSLELTDGAVHLSLNPDRVSAGQIEEQVDNNTGLLDLDPFAPGNADSFFDVFFNLDVGGLVLHNDAALRIEAVIDEKPPQGGRYIHVIPAEPIELLDEAGNRTGFRIVKAEHTTGHVEIDEFPNTVATVVLDIPAAPGIVTTSPQLPPDHGDYRTPADVHAEFHGAALDVILQDIRHRPFAGTVVRDPVAGGEIETFASSLRGTAIVNGQSMPISLTGPVQTFVRMEPGQTTGTFQTEMLSMSLSSGDLTGTGAGLPGVLVRESPTQMSPGQTTVADIGGGQFRIDSFFDVFTELSVDGGNNWVAADAPTRVMLVDSGVETTTPQLPPDDGVYRSPQDIHAQFHGPDLEIILQDVAHRRFANVQIEPVGRDEIETFDSTLTAVANIGSSGLDGVREVVLTGPVQTIVRDRAGEATGSWDTEIVSMSLTGNIGGIPIEIRESPGAASLGHTTITDLGDGTFNVDSFFDVFTEISVGGGPFIPADGVVPVELVPPRQVISAVGPATVAVVFEGAEGVADDDDGNQRDEVETEILSMDLRGTSPRGPVSISVRDDIASTGQIEEQQNAQAGTLDVAPFGDGLADSFFDVWPEIRIGDQVFHTAEPLPLDTIIAHKPPQDGERYVNPYVVRVELVDPATGQGTGIFVVREIHQPDPTIEHDVMEQTTALIQLVGGPIGPNPQAFIVRGPAQADVYFEGPNEGDAVDDNFDGLDEVVSELVSLDLSGGGLTVRESSVRHSLGAITEQVNNTPGLLDLDPFASGNADSFFDVFFEIDLPDGTVLHNERPMRIEAVIDEKPPQGGRYIHVVPDQPVELYDAAGNATGVFIVNAEHFTGFIEWDVLPNTRALIQIEDPAGNVSSHILHGPAEAHVFFEGAEGAADDDDGNSLDEVKTELGSLDLTGDGLTLSLNPERSSPGQIEELVNNTPGLLDLDPFAPGDAASFFDVSFNLDVGGLILHNEEPLRIESIIDEKPPRSARYIHVLPPEPIELYDENGEPTGYRIVHAEHIIVPPGGEIHGTKYLDANDNGRRDSGEAGLPRWTIYVDLNRDGYFDPGSEPFDVTDANGNYWITGLPAGQHRVGEVVPAGWMQTAPANTVFYKGVAPDEVASLVFTDAGGPVAPSQRVAEPFTLGADTRVDSISFLGVYSPSDTPGPDNFTVVFYENDGGAPDPAAVVAVVPVGPAGRVDTGFDHAGLDIYRYQADVGGIVFNGGQTYFVSVYNNTAGDPDDTWAWVGSDIGNIAASFDAGASWFLLVGPDPGLTAAFWLSQDVILAPGEVVDGVDIGNRPRTVEVDRYEQTRALLALEVLGAAPQTFIASGPTTLHVFFEGPDDGDAHDNDNDGRDEVDTEMVQLELTGFLPGVGTVILTLDPTRPSVGQIEENADTLTGRLDLPPFAPAGMADSFFDVFFRVELPDLGISLVAEEASRMTETITHKPPKEGDVYRKVQGSIPLVDEATGQVVAVLLEARHAPVWIPGDSNFDGFVGADDLSTLIEFWNQQLPPGHPADSTGDNFVGADDLTVLIENWNRGKPPVGPTGVGEEDASDSGTRGTAIALAPGADALSTPRRLHRRLQASAGTDHVSRWLGQRIGPAAESGDDDGDEGLGALGQAEGGSLVGTNDGSLGRIMRRRGR